MRSVQSTLFALLAASSAAHADTTLNLTQGVSPISHDVYELHMTIFWICVAIGVVVFSAMIYSIIYHRKSVGSKPASFHSHLWLEIGWTVIPALILIVMAIPATKVLLNMNNYDKEEFTIKITGYQWKWHYEYLEDGISFFSNLSTPFDQIQNKAPKGEFYLREVDNPIVVPIHKKIRFLITSNDVNHAWWVPDLSVKRDAIAGFINEAWTIIDKPGTYRGQCAELCGINHAYMPIVVVATTEQGYKDWIAKQKGQATSGEAETNRAWSMAELMKEGEGVYKHICSTCHQLSGMGLPPTFPALKGSKIATGPIQDHLNIVFNGKAGTAMQAFKGQLSDVEIASVITYERNAFGNNTNSLLQPIQVKALRDGKTLADALLAKPVANAGSTSKGKENAAQTKTDAGKEAGKKGASATSNALDAAATEAGGTAATNIQTGQAQAQTSAPAATAGPGTSPSHTSPTPATGEASGAQVVQQSQSPEEALKAAMERGQKAYLTTCAICHQPKGTGMPPTFPSLKGSPIVKGPVTGHLQIVLFGKQGTAMVAFKDQLKPQEIADIVTYERNAWDNNYGKVVTVEEVTAALNQPPTAQ